jgi:cell division protein ZapE
MPRSILERYREMRDLGQLKPDAAQARAAAVFDTLARALSHYKPKKPGLFGLGAPKSEPPKGLYLHGPVGRGKSLLMDMFFAAAPVAKKRRVHFNAFMQEIHGAIHEWRNLSPGERRRRPEFVAKAGDDPIAPVAKRMSLDATLLCFDELQVDDVADAMILGRLFEKLFRLGVVVVATSNTHPGKLYEGGLNRSSFLPFIALIEKHMSIVELDGPSDYRLERMAGRDLYIVPLGPKADKAMDDAFKRLTGTARGEKVTLNVLGHKLIVPQEANGVARFSFHDLCEKPLGAPDYLALAHTFHTLLVDRIPRMGPEKHNEARRFTVLIDTLYDERVKLVCSAEVPPAELFVKGEKAVSFRRTASRLAEMHSEQYGREKLRAAAKGAA